MYSRTVGQFSQPRFTALCFVWLCAVFWTMPASAAIVELKLASGMPVAADYRPGKGDKPALLLLHGFLQTRDFPTVSRLANSLADAGYTTLSPTLSLGIPNRKQSLGCEAIHNHSLSGDVAELGSWVDWLSARGHRNILIIGHSFGSVQALQYATANPNPAVREIIALSLVDTRDLVNNPNAAMIKDAKARLKRGDNGLYAPSFTFCKRYPTTPKAYLSYADWDRSRILDTLGHSKVAVHIIMGSKDDRMGPDWPDRLRRRSGSVTVIEGANHFFDDQYEFDLLDALLTELKTHPGY
jgi:pimeloyl-ACP methyl ester carboxylesterase